MKKIKKASLLLAIAVISIFILPTTAYAATGHEITSITASPAVVSLDGATVDITLTVKNTGTDTITWVSCYYSLPSGVVTKEHDMMIPVGTSKTFTDTVNFTSTDVNQNISVLVGCLGVGWVNHTTTIKVTGEENVIRSDSSIEPEKVKYFVGDTVSVTDTMRNGIDVDVTNLKMEYYIRRNGTNSAGDSVDFGTLTPNQRVENTLEYAFSESDIGELRIGSKVTYNVSGSGPYTEYNVAHDFVVEAAPTPTSSPTPADSPTPAATAEQTDTPTPETATAEPTEVQSSMQVNETEQNDKTSDNNDSASKETAVDSILSDRTIFMTIIIVAGAVIASILVLLIVIVAEKK